MSVGASSTFRWTQAPAPADLPKVQGIVQERYAESKGVPLWGEITGFLFVYSPTDGILLDLNGNEVESGRKQGRFRAQSIAIEKQLA